MISYSEKNVSRAVNPKQFWFRGKKLQWDKRTFSIREGVRRTSFWRTAVQVFFILLSLLIGWQFFSFIQAAKHTPAGPLPARPSGVEGYLPISGLVGALDWIHQGSLNTIHPAATILFLLFVGLAILFRKSFCGWICPIGFISESLARIGRRIFGRNLLIPKGLDAFLRSLKYIILAFFVWAIFSMSALQLHAFITSPYNKVSDVKMLQFFLNLSSTGIYVIGFLAFGSILVEGLWCRYLCPYGALMGLIAAFSPSKVHRDAKVCTDCGICDKVCPARLPVMSRESVTNVECVGCTDCVTSCPVPGALWFGTRETSYRPSMIAFGIVLALVLVTSLAKLTGTWKSGLTDSEIRQHIAHMDGPGYGHPGMEGR